MTWWISIEDYFITSNSKLSTKLKSIFISSLHLGNFKYIKLGYWRVFKTQINFGHTDYEYKHFTKRFSKDTKNYIYVYPLRGYGKVPLRLVEVFNLLYTILYNNKK